MEKKWGFGEMSSTHFGVGKYRLGILFFPWVLVRLRSPTTPMAIEKFDPFRIFCFKDEEFRPGKCLHLPDLPKTKDCIPMAIANLNYLDSRL